jgi:hypothetical protein
VREFIERVWNVFDKKRGQWIRGELWRRGQYWEARVVRNGSLIISVTCPSRERAMSFLEWEREHVSKDQSSP